jgi:D-sedoheptulose 7-phosphate isomerase
VPVMAAICIDEALQKVRRMWQELRQFMGSRVVGRMNHAETFFAAAAEICRDISFASLEALARELDRLRERKSRLFLIGVGRNAANCSHPVNDFRKLCGIETYRLFDNVSELTARTNDEGCNTVFASWLDSSHLGDKNAIVIYSVGGGGTERNISANIVHAIDLAKAHSAKVFDIVGRNSGYAAKHFDCSSLIAEVNPSWVTPLSEAFQAVASHCLVSHPVLQRRQTEW